MQNNSDLQSKEVATGTGGTAKMEVRRRGQGRGKWRAAQGIRLVGKSGRGHQVGPSSQRQQDGFGNKWSHPHQARGGGQLDGGNLAV